MLRQLETKFISKYLLYGIEECNTKGSTHRYAGLE